MTVLAVSLPVLLFALSALLGLSAWFVYVWAIRDGQFKDTEEPARRMLAQDLDD